VRGRRGEKEDRAREKGEGKVAERYEVVGETKEGEK
jgi:hypothetical protein